MFLSFFFILHRLLLLFHLLHRLLLLLHLLHPLRLAHQLRIAHRLLFCQFTKLCRYLSLLLLLDLNSAIHQRFLLAIYTVVRVLFWRIALHGYACNPKCVERLWSSQRAACYLLWGVSQALAALGWTWNVCFVLRPLRGWLPCGSLGWRGRLWEEFSEACVTIWWTGHTRNCSITRRLSSYS